MAATSAMQTSFSTVLGAKRVGRARSSSPNVARSSSRVVVNCSGLKPDPAADVAQNVVRVAKRDIAFAEERLEPVMEWTVAKTKKDVSTVLDAHDKVAQALNPAYRMNKSLEEIRSEVSTLRSQLSEARAKVQMSEAQLGHTLNRLAEAEAMEVEQQIMKERLSSQQQQQQQAGVGEGGRNDLVGAGTAAPRKSRARNSKSRSNNLKGGELRNFWYPVEFASKVKSDTLIPVELFEEDWVIFRDADGNPGCIRDACAHRACPLSLGEIKDGCVQCPYHGWEYDTKGECTHRPSIPSKNGMKNLAIASLPCVERDGFIFVWPGDETPPAEHEIFTALSPPEGYTIHAEIVIEADCEHGLLMENLLDLAHAPFTHTETFAKGWSVPEFVKFSVAETVKKGFMGGHWEPYPIAMAFQPPCMVISQVGLARPGKPGAYTRQEDCERHLHQLHVCLPSQGGKTRLLYRMSLDFLSFARGLPFMDRVWKKLADQVLGEDMRLVLGQQERLQRGLDVWENPQSYDKLGVQYRRWRNKVASGKASLDASMDL